MPYLFSFTVAGIQFDISSCDELRLPAPWTCYQLFQADPQVAEPWVRVSLRVSMGFSPDVSHFQCVFASESWNLYRDADVYWITLAPGSQTTRSPWVTRLAGDFLSGEVFCDPALSREYGVMFNPVLHRLDQIIAMYLLADRGGGIVHGTGVAGPHGGVVFAGRSGAGKTTLARLLMQSPCAKDLTFLSDDRVIVRPHGEQGYAVFGTPWAGEAQMAAPSNAPLKAVAFLRHAEADTLCNISPREAAAELLPVLSVPWYDQERVERMAEFCHRLVTTVPAYAFEFAPTSNVWKLAHQFFQSLEK